MTVTAMTGTNPTPQRPVVVVAGATERADQLEDLAQELEHRGVEVCVLSGIERTSVPLPQISFRYGEQARYLMCGGPELAADALDKLSRAVEANGVPPANVWGGPVDWDDPAALLRNTEHRLAALGLELGMEVRPPPIAGRMQSHDATPSGKVPIIPPSARPHVDDDEPLRLPRGPFAQLVASRGGMAAIGATLVLAGGLTTLKLAADDPVAEPTQVAEAAIVEPDDGDERDEHDERDDAVEETPKAAPAADAELEPEATELAEPEAAVEEPEVVAEVDDAVAIEADDADDADDALTPAPLADDDQELVYEALKRQSIRALDVLLVSPPALKQRGRRTVHRSMRFEDAEAYCSTLVVDGVAGWRLPEVGEVGWMSKANVVTQGLYWTSTKADAFGTERVVWNVKRRKMAPANVRWRGGRVVCVRFQRPGDGPE